MSPKNNSAPSGPDIPDPGRTEAIGAEKPRQPKPVPIQGHYPVAKMTYVTLSTEDLAGIAFSSGIGSLALSGTLYFAKEAYAASWPSAMVVGMVFFAAMTIAAYVYFGGLVGRIRTRSGLNRWNIFGE